MTLLLTSPLESPLAEPVLHAAGTVAAEVVEVVVSAPEPVVLLPVAGGEGYGLLVTYLVILVAVIVLALWLRWRERDA